MLLKIKIAILFLVVYSVVLRSQNIIAVKSFVKVEKDLTALVDAPKMDQNGDKCAIIKVETTQTGFEWEPDRLGIIAAIPKIGEYWLYVPYGAKRITIKHPRLGVLRDYLYPLSIEKATVYVMKLTTGKVNISVDETPSTKFLIITSNPSGADVFINDQHKGQTPFQKEMVEGEYIYRVAKDFYYPTAGKINLNSAKDKEMIDVQLKPNFGFAQISTKPEDGMNITLDGKMLNQTTPLKTDTLRTGKHSLTISKPLFHSQTKEIVISDNQTTTEVYVLTPAFGSVNLETKPENGATISLDGKQTANITPFKLDRLVSGEHTITFRKEWFEPKTIKVKIEDGINLKQSVDLTSNFGIVKLNSDSVSELFIDNQSKGKGQWEGRLIAGLHTFEAKKDKHHTALQKMIIEVGEEKSISLSPVPIVGKLKIITNAIDATVKLDEKRYGTTPAMISELLAGNYKLTVEKEGFGTLFRNITIEEGKTTEINDTLSTGLMFTIQSTPVGAQLFVDQKEIGKTPLSFMLSYGNHKVRLVNGKKYVDETITVSEKGKTNYIYDVNEVVPVALNGSLSKNSVEIDGKYMGEIPFTARLNIGNHDVKIVKGAGVLEKQIIVTSDGKNEFIFTARDFIKSFYKKHFWAVSYAYHQTTFANTTFAERMANGNLTKDYGHAAAFSYTFFPFEITTTVFSSGFRAHNAAPFVENASIKHQGIELSVNYMPVNLGTSILPYVGAGYQFSRLYSPAGSLTIEGAANANVSMPVVKGGIKLKLGKLFLFGEYNKTIPLDGSNYNSNQLGSGIGWIF